MADRKVEIRIGAKDEASSVLDRLGAGIDRLKKKTGGRSDLKEIGDILRGGGALAGLTLAGRVFADFTEKASDLALRFQKGELSAKEMAGEIARSIPILGQFIQGWDNVLGLITGSTAQVKEMEEATRRTEQHTAQMAKDAAQRAKFGTGLSGVRDALTREGRSIFASPRELLFMAEDQKFKDDLKKIDAQRIELEKTKFKSGDDLAAAQREIDSAETEARLNHSKRLEKIQREQFDITADLVVERAQLIKNIEADADETRLRAKGEFLKADTRQLYREIQSQIDAVKSAGEEAKKVRPELGAFIDDQTNRTIAALESLRGARLSDLVTAEGARRFDFFGFARRVALQVLGLDGSSSGSGSSTGQTSFTGAARLEEGRFVSGVGNAEMQVVEQKKTNQNLAEIQRQMLAQFQAMQQVLIDLI